MTVLLEEEWLLSPQSQAEMQRRLQEAERDNWKGEEWATVKSQIRAGTALDS